MTLMNPTIGEAAPGTRSGALEAGLFVFISWLVLHSIVGFVVGEGVNLSAYRGPDDYTRMARVKDLLDHGWGAAVLDRVGDGGFSHHWTRFIDAWIIGLYQICRLGMPDGAALFWAGALSGPTFHLATLLTSVLAIRRFVTHDTLQVLVLGFLLLPPIVSQFLIGRADHHGPEMGLTLLVLSLGLRIICTNPGWRLGDAMALGSAAALLAWCAPSGMLPAATGVAALGVPWLFNGGHRLALAGFAGAVSATATGFGILFLEYPGTRYPWSELAPDRFSAVHVTLFATIALGFLVASTLSRRDRGFRFRLGITAFLALMATGVLYYFVPDLFRSGNLAPSPTQSYGQLRGARILENRSVFDFYTAADAAKALAIYGVPLVAVVYTFYAIVKRQINQSKIYLVSNFFGMLAYYARHNNPFLLKYTGYLNTAAIFVFADIVGRLAQKVRQTEHSFSIVYATLVKAGSIGLILLLQGFFVAVSDETHPSIAASAFRADCNLTSNPQPLVQLRDRLEPASMILAVPEVSAQLLFHTPYRVMAIPTHRHQPKFPEMFRILDQKDPQKAVAALKTSGISAVLACAYFNAYFGDEAQDSFHGLLSRGEPVDGLVRLSPRDALVSVYVTDFARGE